MVHWIKSSLFLVLALLLVGANSISAEETAKVTYAVVVNKKNAVKFKDDDAAKAEVKQLFLKTKSEWETKEDAMPFAVEDDAQAAFREEVLGMSKAELERHWISMKNKKGVTPPKEVSSTKLLTKYVDKYTGGFGVMPEKEAKASGLRILFTFQK